MAKLKGGTRIYGDIKIDGGIYDSSNQVGAAGSVLLSTGIGISWGTLSFATYATSSGIATYATSSGVSTSVIGGIGSITQLQVTGISTFTNGPVLIGTATSTGTSGQVLQVAGINSSVYIGGNLGIGTTNPTSKLHVVGVVTATAYYGDGSNLSGIAAGISILDNTTTNSTFYVGITSTLSGSLNTLNVSSTKLTFNPSTGNLVAGGTVTANSDEKLKANIKTIDNALEKVLSLRGVEFDRIDTGEHQIGVIAQEVENIIPEVVYPKNPSPNYETKSVAYANLVGLLIEAIKEQNIRIEELERRLGEV